jgi:hypothetical protein
MPVYDLLHSRIKRLTYRGTGRLTLRETDGLAVGFSPSRTIYDLALYDPPSKGWTLTWRTDGISGKAEWHG